MSSRSIHRLSITEAETKTGAAAAGLSLTYNKTAKVAYVPITGLQVGDIITDYIVHAGIGAGSGKATSLDCSLYSTVAKAGDLPMPMSELSLRYPKKRIPW
jgi:hypothetical protein